MDQQSQDVPHQNKAGQLEWTFWTPWVNHISICKWKSSRDNQYYFLDVFVPDKPHAVISLELIWVQKEVDLVWF